MKHILPLIAVASAISLNLQAQSAREVFESKGRAMLMSGLATNPTTAGKNTGTKYRLSRQDDYNDFGAGNEFTDSTRFMYSGSRGSVYNHSPGGFVDIYSLAFGPVTDFLLLPPNPKNVDSILLPLVSFDSLAHFHITAGTSKYGHGEKRSYNNDGTVNTTTALSYGTSGSVSSGVRQVMVYNSGRITRVYSLILNGSAYDTLYMRMIGYNASGNAILDSTSIKSGGVFRPDTRLIYGFNPSGFLATATKQTYMSASSSFVTVSHDMNTYLPSGLLQTRVQLRAPSPGMPVVLTQSDSFGYTPGVPGYTSLHTQGYTSSGTPAILTRLATNHIASNGLKDSMTFSNLNAGKDIFSYKLTYNSMGDPASVWAYDLQASPVTDIFGTKYFYEAYEQDLGAGMQQLSGNEISVFPNPTTGRFTFSYPGAKSGMPVTIRITNSMGQAVHAEMFTMQGTSQLVALGDDTAPGTYYLSVYDGQGKPIGAQQFLKL